MTTQHCASCVHGRRLAPNTEIELTKCRKDGTIYQGVRGNNCRRYSKATDNFYLPRAVAPATV